MKIRILAVLFLVLCLPFAISANEMRFGVIDLTLAVSLHPRMALFDFDRMGFFKVAPGLSQEAFDKAVLDLKNSEPALEKAGLLRANEDKLSELDIQKSHLIAQLSMPQTEEFPVLQQKLQQLEDEIQRISGENSDLRHAAMFPELTEPAETRKILDEIENEVLKTIAGISAEEKFTLVFNSTVPVPYGYPVRYQSGEMYGQGIPGINFSLFYSFLAKNKLAHPFDETPPSRELINWLELTRFPEAVNLLPIRPYPLVLSGGENILSRVMQRIYTAHKIAPEVYKVVDSVIHKIDEPGRTEGFERR
ncbi:MAG: OmpH family outer membrane protein [Candidatus Riflebacteria bacterium]|nr:OmpH family outer membrane protein [Candidatus Riflebacteria bacterium]